MRTGTEAGGQAGKEFVIETVADIDAIWPELEPLLLGLIEYHQPWDNRTLKPDWATVMRSYMSGVDMTLIARDSAGRAVGFVSGGVSDALIFSDITGHIDNIFVAEEARGQGAGAALLSAFEAWCRERGASEVRLEVNDANERGRGFWGDAGYRVSGLEMRRLLEARP